MGYQWPTRTGLACVICSASMARDTVRRRPELARPRRFSCHIHSPAGPTPRSRRRAATHRRPIRRPVRRPSSRRDPRPRDRPDLRRAPTRHPAPRPASHPPGTGPRPDTRSRPVTHHRAHHPAALRPRRSSLRPGMALRPDIPHLRSRATRRSRVTRHSSRDSVRRNPDTPRPRRAMPRRSRAFARRSRAGAATRLRPTRIRAAGRLPAARRFPAAGAGPSFDPSKVSLAGWGVLGAALLTLVASFFRFWSVSLGDFGSAGLLGLVVVVVHSDPDRRRRSAWSTRSSCSAC